MKKNKRQLRTRPFGDLEIEEKFDRLFERGFTREEAEVRLNHPYKALILPGKIIELWKKAKSSTKGLDEVYAQLGGFDLQTDPEI
ncbi:unnamed protein product, partial [marine sediment metagenome]